MNSVNEPVSSRMLTVWRRYLPAVNGIILSIPVLFYLLVVKSSESELVYTFRISNATDFFVYDVQVKSVEEFRCAVPPRSESEMFTMRIRRDIRAWFSKETLTVTVRPCADSLSNPPPASVIRFYDDISPERLNRIHITAESINAPVVIIE